jgi:hypothetical protein
MTDENTVDNQSNNVHTNGEVENSHQPLPLPPLSMKNIKYHLYIFSY